MFRKRELKYHVYCGGKSSQHTFNAFVQIYTYAKENGYNKIIVDFIDPETIDLKKENLQLKEKIEKAIEYLETAAIDLQSMLHYRNCLLDILKGDNNE